MENFADVTSEDLLRSRVTLLECEVKSLRALVGALPKAAMPFEPGNLAFPPGDNIPKRSNQDYNVGLTFAGTKDGEAIPYRVVKNDTYAPLVAGQEFGGGIVDTKLTVVCEPNNLCYVEL
jgi:hypothetical protein